MWKLARVNAAIKVVSSEGGGARCRHQHHPALPLPKEDVMAEQLND
jgi:hypothetical protein